MYVSRRNFGWAVKYSSTALRHPVNGRIVVNLYVAPIRNMRSPRLQRQANGIIEVSVNVKQRYCLNVGFWKCFVEPTFMEGHADRVYLKRS